MIGLGLMGASYALGLSREGYEVYGYDLDQRVMQQAITEQIIKKESSLAMMNKVDLVMLCLYPKQNSEFIRTYGYLLKEGQILTDLSGTKVEIYITSSHGWKRDLRLRL